MCTCKCCIDELTCVAPIGGSITQHKSLIKATERKAHSIYYANPDKPFEKTRPQNHKVKILILSHAFIFFLCSFMTFPSASNASPQKHDVIPTARFPKRVLVTMETNEAKRR